MLHKTEYSFLLLLSMLATCPFPSLSDTDAQILVRFKGSLSNADALRNWGDESINLCNWVGLLCKEQKLHGLKLENMGLSGKIDVDTLLELSSLNTFSVMNNNFQGPMPEFKKIVTLRGLFLSNNKFSGEIPDDAFGGMRAIKRVLLAGNGFSGHIPSSLAQLPRLLDVDLHGNSFGGNIPEFRQRDFRVFDLSNNQLEGPIPESLSNRDPRSFAGNKGLCGKPLNNLCNNSVQPNPLPHEEKGNNKKKKQRNILISAIIVVVVVILASCIALLLIRRRRRRQSDKKPALAEAAAQQQSNSTTASVIDSKSYDDVAASVVASNNKKNGDQGGGGGLNFVRRESEVVAFDLQDLLRASAEVLGSGSFGSTYKAMVASGPIVAVKRFKHMNSVGRQEFHEHMKRLGRLTHPNLLPLVAFYYGKEEKLLVYDFVHNGSLASHLHGRRGSGLDWATRVKIIKGVARGISHLHREFPEQKVPHGHLKSSNVLLSRSMEPLLTEYGLVPVVNKAHAKQFMASFKSPEARQHDRPGERTDVWCLGILILEVVTGKFPASYLRHGKEEESEELEEWVKSVAKEGWSGEEGEMVKLLRIGVGCCEWDWKRRLDWREAVAKIEELKEMDVVEDESSAVSDLDFSL